MDTATGVIPDFSLVQVSETTSSAVMELLGFQHSFASIEAADLSVNVVVTDRHVQIRRNENRPQRKDSPVRRLTYVQVH